MPIYDYRCGNCGKISEVLVVGRADEAVSCPACGSLEMVKIMSAPGGVRVGGAGAVLRGEEGGCCGMTNPCDNPKRCCTK